MFESFVQTLNDPHARHAMLIHWPIVLGLAGILPLIALACYRFKNTPLSIACAAWFLAGMIGAGLAAGAGEEAAFNVTNSQPPLTQTEYQALEEHEELGEGGWLWFLPPLAFAAGTLIPRSRLRLTAGVLAIAASLTTAGWVILTAHSGGKLVYTHGLGVPERTVNVWAWPDEHALPTGPRHSEDPAPPDDER